jgi:1-pyrroline-5-carboxylate dehydrogenase
VPGEENRLFYIPLGCGTIIPPWNFPMAILCGMTSAAWIAGNTVVLKPASTTPMMGWLYMEIVKEAGLPEGVVNYLSGPGAIAGNTLVEHPRTRFVCFTGSMEVGLGINAKAATHRPGQIWIKRVVAEMGGKDGIIVDAEADLDQAVDGVLASAFGYQGQKCSACSRAIVDESLYDSFVEKLVPKVKALTQGDPTDPGNYMGPVIDKNAFDKIMSYMEPGKKEGRLVAGGEGDDSTGFFIQPTVFADIPPRGRLAQEEIFGPILSVIKAKNWEDALEIANNTEYGLTGAVYSRNPKKLEEAVADFHVGNLYLNRKCTGALVGGHPFGGFNMSGTDSKAGGRDYLLLFLQAKSTSTKVS